MRSSCFCSKKANLEIAMLVIFIALVFGITIFTGQTIMQMKDARSGAESARIELSKTARTSIEIDNVISKGNEAQNVDLVIITARLPAMSEPIDLNDVTILIKQKNATSALSYRNGTLERDIEHGYYTQ